MSINIMVKVFQEANTQGSERLVLLALADNANDENVCWPSLNKIAKKCNLSRRFVVDIIKKLEDRNYISHKTRCGKGGRFTSSIYLIHTENFIFQKSEEITEISIEDFTHSEPEFTSEAGLTTLVNQLPHNPSEVATSLKSSLEPSIETSFNSALGAPSNFNLPVQKSINNLEATSQWGLYLMSVLTQEAMAKRGGPVRPFKRFKSLENKRIFEEAEARLGDDIKEAIRKAMAAGRTSIESAVNYLGVYKTDRYQPPSQPQLELMQVFK